MTSLQGWNWMGKEKALLTRETILFNESITIAIGSDWSGGTGHAGNSHLHSYNISLRIASQFRRPLVYSPRVRALVLSPSPSITSGEGPTNAMPACSTFFANPAFSDKNPYLILTNLVKEFGRPKTTGSLTQDGSCQRHVPVQS